jgi:5-(carboxyamino)imidazole ribonucleotide synthase
LPPPAIRDLDGPLPPGTVVGILGSGQLGRMLVLAAARLGYRCHVLSPEADAPAVQVTDRATIAPYDDLEALAAFARRIDVATFEFENFPYDAIAFLAERVAMRPCGDVLAICQDRIREKQFLSQLGVPVPAFAQVSSPAELADALPEIGTPAVLKSARFGYDGKGQVAIGPDVDPALAWQALSSKARPGAAILEAWIDFRMEVSVIVARAADGTVATYVPVQNIHENHILRRTIAPAPLPPELAAAADALARRVAEALELVGLLAVEMFLTRDDRFLVNELAPRPHNSGHWTIDACATSQFEQCIRAVCGLPLGPTARFADAEMENLLGFEIGRWPELAAEPGARVHLYGKTDIRPGRKVGHVTRLKPCTGWPAVR